MNLPNLALLHAYGNEQALLEKAAGYGALAARLAVGMMAAGRASDQQAEDNRLRAQAQAMNEAFRALEAQKMMPVRERMAHTRMPMVLMAMRPQGGGGGGMGLGAPLENGPPMMTGEDVPLGMDEGMVRMASAIGSDLALYSWAKEAGIGGAFGNVMKGFGSAVGGMGRGAGMGLMRAGQATARAPGAVGGAIKNFAVGKLQSAGQAVQGAKNKIQGAVTGAERGLNRVAGRLENFGAKMEQKGLGQASQATQKPFSQMSAGQKQLAADARLNRMQQGGFQPGGKVQSPAGQPQGMPQPPKTPQDAGVHPPAAQGAQLPSGGKSEPQPVKETTPGAPETPKPEGEGGGGFDIQKAWERTGLHNGQWKWKLPMLGAGLAGMYGLYQGAKKGLDILGREPGPEQYNAGAAMPAYGVNEYGAPDRSTPFTM